MLKGTQAAYARRPEKERKRKSELGLLAANMGAEGPHTPIIPTLQKKLDMYHNLWYNIVKEMIQMDGTKINWRAKAKAAEAICKKIHKEERKETSKENSGMLTALYNVEAEIGKGWDPEEGYERWIEIRIAWNQNWEENEIDKEERSLYTGYIRGYTYALKKIKEAIKWQKENT